MVTRPVLAGRVPRSLAPHLPLRLRRRRPLRAIIDCSIRAEGSTRRQRAVLVSCAAGGRRVLYDPPVPSLHPAAPSLVSGVATHLRILLGHRLTGGMRSSLFLVVVLRVPACRGAVSSHHDDDAHMRNAARADAHHAAAMVQALLRLPAPDDCAAAVVAALIVGVAEGAVEGARGVDAGAQVSTTFSHWSLAYLPW